MTQEQIEQLETQGYTVLPQFLDDKTTARVRARMDALLPPVSALAAPAGQRIHTLRHPIPGAIMAEILTPNLVQTAGATLCSDEVRLLEQVLIRTDPQTDRTPANGWHIDMAFLPEHYEARPRQTYFHMVHCLNSVQPGGGAFTIVPGSHHQTYAAAKELGTEERLTELKRAPAKVAGVDINAAVEVCPEDGDLLIFDPMALHSPSVNTTACPRYVYFASFYDDSADYLKRYLAATNYLPNFSAELRENLPAQLQPLLQHGHRTAELVV